MMKKGIAVLLVLITIWTLLAGCASKPADAVPDRKDPFVYCGVCPDLCVYAAGVLLSAVVCALLRGAGRGWLPVAGRRPAGTAPHSGALM